VNQLRHQYRALQSDATLQFHQTDNPHIIAYSKSMDRERLFVVVNLDPHYLQHGFVRVPTEYTGSTPDDFFFAHDLLDDVVYRWRGEWNYVRFDPGIRQGHILKLEIRN
jgi:starch synthase (maltosyl-transferring)